MIDFFAQIVSIRARHHWRAILSTCSPWPAMMVFQSAPAITGGRSGRELGRKAHPIGFNPRPPSLAGDPTVAGLVRSSHEGFNPRPPSLAGDPAAGRSGWINFIGFNPRPPSLAGDPGVPTCARQLKGCFNPRPPSLAGDPCRNRNDRNHRMVSIRARHHWRAIQRRWARGRVLNGFNPRPPSLAGDPSSRRLKKSR